MSESTELSFSEAYDQLKEITDKLNGEQVDADELVDLLRRGKGLEAALRSHLTDIEQEVKAIEDGQGIAAYKIVAKPDQPADTSDFETNGDSPVSAGSSEEDIPF